MISKEALIRLGSELERNDLSNSHSENCPSSKAEGPEDVLIGKCLEHLGVSAEDSRDANHRWKFHPLTPEFHLIPHEKKDFWFFSYSFYPTQEVRIWMKLEVRASNWRSLTGDLKAKN